MALWGLDFLEMHVIVHNKGGLIKKNRVWGRFTLYFHYGLLDLKGTLIYP